MKKKFISFVIALIISITGGLSTFFKEDLSQFLNDIGFYSWVEDSKIKDIFKEFDKNFHDYDIQLDEIPNYSGKPYVVINNNEPFFEEKDYSLDSFEEYGMLDYLGRCTVASACLNRELMPKDERGDISEVKPTGWHNVSYDFIENEFLYNRCHLIGFQLSGENANERNLITGTRYMNVEGMLPFENKVAQYIKDTHHHVLYRVTPIFEGVNMLASGVLMEAKSIEDDDINFCVYIYNVQPGVEINYLTGYSYIKGE